MRISDWSSDVCSSDLSAGGTADGGATWLSRDSRCRAQQSALAAPARRLYSGRPAEWNVCRCRLFLHRHLSEPEQAISGDHDAVDPFDFRRDSALVRAGRSLRSEEHTSELQSLMRISYAVFCLKKKKKT